MADEKFYQTKLENDICASVVAADSAKKYIAASNKQRSLVTSICGRLTGLLNITPSEADTYINITYGTFRPGRRMAYCTDSQLKQFFAMLEEATKELHKYPFRTSTEANNNSSQKLAQMNQTVAEVRRIFGDDKARQMVAKAKVVVKQRTGIQV